MTTSTTEMSAALDTYYEASSQIYGDTNSATSAAEAVRRSWYRDMERLDADGLRVAQAFTDISAAYGMDSGGLVYNQREIMAKWGIPDEEALTRLIQINELTQSMKGDPRKNLQTNISLLKDYDDILQNLGFTYDESLSLLGAWNDAELDSTEILGQAKRVYQGFETQIGQSAEKVATLTDEITALAAEGKDTSAKSAELAAWQALVGADAGQLTRTIFDELSKGDDTSAMLGLLSGVSGKDKQKLMEGAKAYRDIGQYDYTVTDDMVTKITTQNRSFLDDMGLMWQNFVGNLSQAMTPDSTLSKQYEEYRAIADFLQRTSPESAAELYWRYVNPGGVSTTLTREEALQYGRDEKEKQMELNLTISGLDVNQKMDRTVIMVEDSAGVYTGIAQYTGSTKR